MTHPDFQNIVEWDGPALFTDLAVPGPLTTPVFPVSQWYGCMLHTVIAAGSQWLVEPLWYVDAAATIRTGGVELPLEASISAQCGAYLRHLGPYMQLFVQKLSGPGTIDLRVIGTNRVGPYPFGAIIPALVDVSPAVGAGATVTQFPGAYWAGPVSIQTSGSQAGYQVFLDYVSPLTGAYSSFFGVDITDLAHHNLTTICPLAGWRVRLLNTSGVANTIFCKVTPAVSGSS